MPGNQQSRRNRFANTFGIKWRKNVNSITGIVALSTVAIAIIAVVVVAVFLLAESAGSSTSPPSSPEPPVRVDSVLLQPNVNEGQTFVFPDALEFSQTELQTLTKFSSESIQGPDTFYAWARNHGGIDPDQVRIQIVVSGNRSHEVRIIGMRAVGVCGPPLTGTMMASGAAGGERNVGIGFDLDTSDPDAKSYENGYWGRDYFLNNTVSLNPNEQQAFTVIGASLKHDCNFKIQLIILDGTKHVAETIGNGINPFHVSGTLPPTRYQAFYVGGVADSCPPGFPWMKINANHPHC